MACTKIQFVVLVYLEASLFVVFCGSNQNINLFGTTVPPDFQSREGKGCYTIVLYLVLMNLKKCVCAYHCTTTASMIERWKTFMTCGGATEPDMSHDQPPVYTLHLHTETSTDNLICGSIKQDNWLLSPNAVDYRVAFEFQRGTVYCSGNIMHVGVAFNVFDEENFDQVFLR